MRIPGLGRLYGWGRDVIPLRWRRAIRRRFPVERLFGIRKTVFGPALPPSPREERPGRPDVFLLSHGEWNFRRQRPQQLASALGKIGGRVFFAELGAAGPGSPEPGVVLFPVAGARREDLYDRALEGSRLAAAIESIRSAAATFSVRHAVVLVELPYWRPLADALRAELGWKIAYDCIDDHEAFSTVRKPFVQEEERRLARDSDLVLASSKKLVEKMSSLHERVLLLRNAADFDFFSGASTRPAGQRPRLGYFGAVSEWFDLDLVTRVAQRRPEWDFEIVGSTFGSEAQKVRLPNVRFVGEVSYAKLPGLLSAFDVSMIPFRIGPLIEATNPVKVYEMLASGKPVVATPIPELRALAADGLVRLASGAEEFEAALADALAEDDPAVRARRVEFARTNSWTSRAEELRARMRSLFVPASVVVVTYESLEYNRACLSSLLSETDWPNLELIFVDNGSKDGTREWLLGECAHTPELRVIANDANLGFAPAVNRGLAAASGARLCLLNNDTVVTRGWLSGLLAHLERDPKLGMVGASTNEIANEARVPVSYQSLSELRDWAREFTQRNRNQLISMPMLAMFCTAFRRSLFDEVGPLDERFSVGMFEDDDYSRRVLLAGYELACARDSFVHHRGRASFEKLGEEKYLEIYRSNEERFRQKWGGVPRSLSGPGSLPEALRGAQPVIVFPPTIGWNVTLVQRPHHLARAFARLGTRVVFDCGDHPADAFAGFREVEPGLHLFRGEPGELRALEHPIVWSFAYNFPARSEWPAARIVYDCIDHLDVFPHPKRDLRRRHEGALREADAVFAVSRPLLAEMAAARPDAKYLPNAVEFDRFDAVPARRDSGPPVAVYVGALARWVDFELLAAVARDHPDWEFRLYGEILDGRFESSGVTKLRNVIFRGACAHDSIPDVLAAADVGLIPFRVTPETNCVSPIKLYEYLAAGRPVVSSPMEETRTIPGVWTAATRIEWRQALSEALAASKDEGFRARIRGFARENDWSARARQALAHLVY
jgi:GT2 family glycosyltransferase/glycosyltransferase involved in cell wall biosynthesis